ncbi:hypothetical protein D3C73_1115040 [compost metagenome]
MLGGKRFVSRYTGASGPLAVFRRNFGGHVNVLPLCLLLANDLSHQLLAVAIPVPEGGIDKVKAQLNGAAQRLQRLVVAGSNPSGFADPPSPVANFGNPQPGSAQ